MLWALMLGLTAATAVDPAPWVAGTNIQRTMRLLATSTKQHPNRVKILFYGQSITKQDWWKTVAQDLKRRFPYADLVCENRAIGGFAANLLKQALQHDVFPSYPDLIILHDYGGEPDYEELIRRMRANVASEILVQSDHYTNAPPKTLAWHDRHVDWLRALAAKCDLGFVDIRTPWHRFLTEKGLAPDALLIDGVHLNGDGCSLMASLVDEALVYDPHLTADPGLGRELPLRWAEGRARVTFQGNRVDISLESAEPIEVRIDGKRPSEIPELYQITRPSDCFAVDVPAVFRVDHQAPLVLEDWTLTMFDISPDATRWRFRVHGSTTGDDGEGASDKPFVSHSGRVVIGPGSWYVPMAFQISKKLPPEGFTIRWQVVPEFLDRIPATKGGTVTVAQGLKNGRHTIELIGDGRGQAPGRVTAYRPPL